MALNLLLDEAHRLLATGEPAAALRVFEQILDGDPDHPDAINAVAMGALGSGQVARAIALLTRRLDREPADAVARHHLAQVQRQAGDRTGAVRNWSAVLRSDPAQYVARLALAQMLDEDGDAAAALPHYFRAITDAQAQGRWMSRESTPPSLLQAVSHAMRRANTGRHELYNALLDPLRARFGRAAMARVDRCLAIYLAEQRAETTDPRQQPGFLFFPGLPTAPYLDSRAVPELENLATKTSAIVEELRAVMSSTEGQETVFHNRELEQANLAGAAPTWNGYYFYRGGVARNDNRAVCPQTAAAVDQLPLCRVTGHGPEVLFSVLSPDTHLLPHRGVTNTRIVGHLPLIVPPQCALRVADIEHAWTPGVPVLFDDTYLHEAWNRSSETRVVLIFDVWNPYLRPEERVAVTDLVTAIGAFRAAAEQLPS